MIIVHRSTDKIFSSTKTFCKCRQKNFNLLLILSPCSQTPYSKPFQSAQEALEATHYMSYTLSDDSEEECIDICLFPPEESWCLTDEKDVNEGIFELVLPANVCNQIEILTKISNNELRLFTSLLLKSCAEKTRLAFKYL